MCWVDPYLVLWVNYLYEVKPFILCYSVYYDNHVNKFFNFEKVILSFLWSSSLLMKLDRSQLGTGIVGLCASLNVARISVNASQLLLFFSIVTFLKFGRSQNDKKSCNFQKKKNNERQSLKCERDSKRHIIR